jgi:integrase
MSAELSMRAVAALPQRRAIYRVAANLYVSKAKLPGFWLLNYVSPTTGKRTYMGLGSIETVPLKAVKLEAAEFRLQIARGRCPLSERQAAQAAKRSGFTRTARGSRTFEGVAEEFISFHRPTWTSKRHAHQWEASLRTYAYPVIGNLPIAHLDVGDVLRALEPIWRQKAETASRVRNRIESVVDYAKARKWFTGENPARWKGHLDQLLPKRSHVAKVEHLPAMPWQALPSFYSALTRSDALGALLLRYQVLAALRPGAARLAEFSEFDLTRRVHTVPALPGRKTAVAFDVPLSAEATRVLDLAKERSTSTLVFNGQRVGRPVSEQRLRNLVDGFTPHGFRSSFRDWCADHGVERDLAEQCLGHAIDNKVEAAYRRSTMLERRRDVMERWARYVTGEVVDKPEDMRLAG